MKGVLKKRPSEGPLNPLTLIAACGTLGAIIAFAPSAHGAPPEIPIYDGTTPAIPVPLDPGPTTAPEEDQQGSGAPTQSSPMGAGAEPVPTTTPAPAPTPIPALSARDAWEQAPRHRIAVMPRYSYRVTGTGRAVTPTSGFGIAGTIEITYLRLLPGLEGALGIDFSHDRFSSSEVGSVVVGDTTEMFRNPRVTSETSFVLVHTAAVSFGRVRPYLTLGAGLGLGYFDSAAAELRPGTARDTHALGRVSIGVDVTVTRDWNLSVRADYTALRGVSTLVTDAGDTLSLFGDLFGLGAGIAYRF